MIYDANEAAPPPRTYDVCIVGAGAAGLTLATQLLSRGKRVLLLESGGTTEDLATAALKQVVLTGHPYTGTIEGRFRTLGGTTTRWGGQFAEFDEHDFTPRPWLTSPSEPATAWPFPRSELRPFYDRAYAAVGLDPALASDPAVWNALHIQPPPASEDLSVYFTRFCRQPDFSQLYADAIRSEGLDVCLHTNAVEMVLEAGSANAGRIRELRCVTVAGKQLSFRAETFVLALGTIETSHFLLQPRADGGAQPWHSPQLGRHFQDHLAGYCGGVHVRDWPALRRYFENVYRDGLKFNPKFKLTAAAQQRERTLNVGGTINFIEDPRTGEAMSSLKSAVRAATRGRLATSDWKRALSNGRALPIALRTAATYALRHRAYHPASTTVLLGVEVEQDPNGDSRITLDSTRDATGLFRASLDFHISPLEVATVRHFATSAAAWLERNGIATVELDADLLRDPARYVAALHDTYHPSGGTRMGTAPANGVVDADLCLFGTTNTYVLSCSVFPSSSYSNPTFTLLALACRLADRL